MLLVRSTPDAHKTPLYQMKIKIEGRSAAWKSQTMIVMLKDDLNTLICLFTEDWMKLYQFGIKLRGTFTRFNVERTYQTLTKWCENFSMKTLFSKQEKSIKICCFKCFKVNWKKKRRIAMLCWKNYQVNRSFILLLRWMETFATLNPAWWKKNWICCFDMKENDQNNTDSLIHKIRVNFRWLNISGNKQLKKTIKNILNPHMKSVLKPRLRETWYVPMFKVQDQLNQDARITYQTTIWKKNFTYLRSLSYEMMMINKRYSRTIHHW